MANRINTKLTEQCKFGRLRPLHRVRDDWTAGGQKKPVWAFACDCGETAEIRAYSVTSGKTQSCGCLSVEALAAAHTRHGAACEGALSPEYKAWRNMLTRARNPNISHAERYSKRGITVCQEWLPGGDGNGFARFLAHIGPKPSGTSLDRVDNERGYEPGNVRWATLSQQARNKSGTKRAVGHDGKEVPVAAICEEMGISLRLVHDRIRLGWPQSRWFEPKGRGAS